MGAEEPRPQGQARPLLLAPLARFVFPLCLRQWLPLLATTTPVGRLAAMPRPSSY